MSTRGGNIEPVGDPSIGRLTTLSLEQALEKYANFPSKRAYYVDHDESRGMRLFGIVGHSDMFVIPEEVYETIGMPNEDEEVLVSNILEKAGYEF